MRKLGEIADVMAGYPFRGHIEHDPDGEASVIQMKHADLMGGVRWHDLPRTKLEGRKKPVWLKPQDIIFGARGNRNYAVCLDHPPEHTVCSPHFFRVHVKNTKQLLPEFLAWFINQAPAQKYFATSSQGAMIRNIRRGFLESLPVVIPPLETQAMIAKFDELVKQEYFLLQKNMENSQAMMRIIARDLMTGHIQMEKTYEYRNQSD